jgi:hypothetical protein
MPQHKTSSGRDGQHDLQDNGARRTGRPHPSLTGAAWHPVHTDGRCRPARSVAANALDVEGGR